MENLKFSAVLVERSSKRYRAFSAPSSVRSARYMASASEMRSPGPCPPESTTGTPGWVSRYAAAASMRLRSAAEGVSPLTPAPRTMTASTGTAELSASPRKITVVSMAIKSVSVRAVPERNAR